MAASFPVTFPSTLAITGTQTLQDVGHTDNLHVKDRDEIIASQTKLGLGSSVASGTTALLGTGGTQSAWGQITDAYIAGTAAIAVTKLAPASANGSVLTTAAGTARWALVTNDNIAGTAAIAVSKLAASGAEGQFLSQQSGTIVYTTGGKAYLGGTILAAAAALVDVTGISGSFRTLVVEIAARSGFAGTVDNLLMRVGDSGGTFDAGSNYDWQLMTANGNAAVNGNENLAIHYYQIGQITAGSAPANSFGRATVRIPYYSTAGMSRGIVSNGGARIGTATANLYSYHNYGGWRGTAVIDRLRVLTSSGGSLDVGTSIRVYGEG